MSTKTHYETLADLFVYPQAEYPERVNLRVEKFFRERGYAAGEEQLG